MNSEQGCSGWRPEMAASVEVKDDLVVSTASPLHQAGPVGNVV
jgi:hypothetical protein